MNANAKQMQWTTKLSKVLQPPLKPKWKSLSPPVPPKNGRGLFLRDTNNAGSENREGVERETEIEGKDNLFEWIQGIMLI